MAALAAPTTGPPMSEARPYTPDDTLALEAVELSMERERLEVMEHQVATAEDALASRVARVQREVDQKVAGIRETLVEEYRQKLELQEARFKQLRDELQGKADALEEKLTAARESR